MAAAHLVIRAFLYVDSFSGHHPDEDDERFSAKPNSVAPSENGGEDLVWTGDGGIGPADNAYLNRNTNNSNNRNSDDLADFDGDDDRYPWDDEEAAIDDAKDDHGSPSAKNNNSNNNNNSRRSAAEALIVPDRPPAKIKTGSPIKAMQSFPTKGLRGSVSPGNPTPQAEVDV